MSEHFNVSERLEDWVEGHGEPLTFSQASLLPDEELLAGALNRIEAINQTGEDVSHEEFLSRMRQSGIPDAIAEIALYATVQR